MANLGALRKPEAGFLPGSETGASLISMLITAGALAVFIMVTHRAWVNMSQSSKMISASQNFDQIDTIINREISRIITEKSTCYQPADFTIGMASSMGRLQTAVSTDILAGQSQAVRRTIKSSPNIQDAIKRCQQQTTITAINDSRQNAVRFCLKLNRDPNASKNGILASEGAFAELTILLKDNRSGQNLSCQQFLSSPHGGAQVYYSYYWTTDLGQRMSYRSQNGFYLISRGQ
ncbi:MAG: hypothetical protein ACOH5I_22130 [Oligoflexus sp.]